MSISRIDCNMQVSIPDEIYEKFLFELGRDGFVFATFGEYTLTLSMPDIEPIQTPDDAGMSRDELDKRYAFYKSLNFVKSLKVKDGEYDLPTVDGKHSETGRRQGNTKALCKCGHWIGIVGTKWQHMGVIITDSCGGETPPKSEVKYSERCYYCDCSTPTPAEE